MRGNINDEMGDGDGAKYITPHLDKQHFHDDKEKTKLPATADQLNTLSELNSYQIENEHYYYYYREVGLNLY